MPPVIYPPLDNPDRALIHLTASHGRRPADWRDADLLLFQVEHFDAHADPCDHIHDTSSRVLAFLHQLSGVTGP